jgi:shikimate dehydrogenase
MPGAEPVRRAAVLGHPIAHSLSPVLHLAAYQALGLTWTYEHVDVTGDQLPAFVQGLDSTWVGLSLTMPLKEDVLPLLDEVDDIVTATRAANTVVLREGRRVGANTDVAGIVQAFREAGASGGADETPRSAAVLGGGATARSALASLAVLGVASVTAYARRAEAGADLRRTGAGVGLEVVVAGWQDAPDALNRDLVVSTVPRGVCDALAASVPTTTGVLLDVVYDPWPTALAAAWMAAGGAVASGLDMLLHQAVEQVRLMTGHEPPVDLMRAALNEAATGR